MVGSWLKGIKAIEDVWKNPDMDLVLGKNLLIFLHEARYCGCVGEDPFTPYLATQSVVGERIALASPERLLEKQNVRYLL